MFNIKNLKIKENYIPFTEYQLAILDMQQFNGGKTKKIQSVLRYVMKYSPNGKLVYSIHRLYKMYTWKGKRMSQRYFYNLIAELKELNLLEDKDGDIYVALSKKQQDNESDSDSNVQEELQEKVQEENSSESVENTNVLEGHAPSLETSRLNINYNNSNGENFTFSLVDEIKKLYRGIKGRRYASKKEMKDIAKVLMVKERINNSIIQAKVFGQIDYLRTKIELAGVVAYVEKIVYDKWTEFDLNDNTYIQINSKNIELEEYLGIM